MRCAGSRAAGGRALMMLRGILRARDCDRIAGAIDPSFTAERAPSSTWRSSPPRACPTPH
jgi:hypothetical protein